MLDRCHLTPREVGESFTQLALDLRPSEVDRTISVDHINGDLSSRLDSVGPHELNGVPSTLDTDVNVAHRAAVRSADNSSSDSDARIRTGATGASTGKLARLGHTIAASTVWKILRTAGINPTLDRTGPTWIEFIRSQAAPNDTADVVPIGPSHPIQRRNTCGGLINEYRTAA